MTRVSSIVLGALQTVVVALALVEEIGAFVPTSTLIQPRKPPLFLQNDGSNAEPNETALVDARRRRRDSAPASKPASTSDSYPRRQKDVSRRSILSRAATAVICGSATTSTMLPGPAVAEIGPESDWPLWPALPVAPYSRRKTIRREVGPGVWAFDQMIGIYYVQVPIRMTVVEMKSGGLLVYAPVAPTKECLGLLQDLIDRCGPVRYIILPSVAVEHKVLAGPFARSFPSAEFYVVDQQYSFPLNLPDSTLGFPAWTKKLPASSRGLGMWGNEFEHEVLTVKPGVASEFQDVALFHAQSKTLLVCDSLFATNGDPPAILESDPEYTRALLFHARDDPLELVEDTPEARRKGWRRIVLLFNFFFPSAAVVDLGVGPLLKLRPYELGWGGWMPFKWKSVEAELESFEAFRGGGKPSVYPIVQIILARGNSGEALRQWVDKVTSWNFDRVIPAHLDAPLAFGPKEFAETFDFARSGRNTVRFCDKDVKLLRAAEEGPLNFSVYKSSLGTLMGKSCNP